MVTHAYLLFSMLNMKLILNFAEYAGIVLLAHCWEIVVYASQILVQLTPKSKKMV